MKPPCFSLRPSETQGGSVLQGSSRDDGADRPEKAAAVRSPDTRPEQRRQETHHRQTRLGQRVRNHTNVALRHICTFPTHTNNTRSLKGSCSLSDPEERCFIHF